MSISGVRNTSELLNPNTRLCALLIAEPKVGKMQSLNSKVLTPTGWVRMGDLKVGQRLASVDGKPSYVLGIFPHTDKELFRVTFHDGRSTLVGADHLWPVSRKRERAKDQVVDTAYLQALPTESLQEYRIPTFTGHFGVDDDLPIEPWLLGSLLGDGGFTGALAFTKLDPGVVEAVAVGVGAEGCELRVRSGAPGNYQISGRQYHQNPLLPKLEQLGLRGHLSIHKFIPAQYLNATRESRLALLRGLMDTDGSAEGTSRIFNTSSLQLALDVQYLVRSLGGIAVMGDREPFFTYKSERRTGQTAYRMSMSNVPDAVFQHSRKAGIEHLPTKQRHLYIESIEPAGREDARCIQVSHSSALYVTDDFIVTHNTLTASSLNDITLKHRGKKTLIIACEEAEGGGTMTLNELNVDYKQPKNWQEMEQLLAELATDEDYAGVILDNATDYVGRIVKPYALKFPSKEENSKFAGTRTHGVLQQSDYLPVAEFARQQLAKLVGLTNPDTTAERYRKDLIVTCLEKEHKTRDGKFLGFRPDLPGSLATSVTAMFQSVLWLRKDAKVVDAGKPTARRLDVRSLVSGGDADRAVMGDRMKMFPLEYSLTDGAGKPVGLLPLYEEWRGRMGKAA